MTDRKKEFCRELLRNALFTIPACLLIIFVARQITGESAGSIGFYLYAAVVVLMMCIIGTGMPYIFGKGDEK